MSLLSQARSRFLGISDEEVRFTRRGFPGDVPGIRERLERAGAAFVRGYNAALRERGERLTPLLNDEEHDLQGFTHEGAAMGLALVDLLAPWTSSRWLRLLESRGASHGYLILVGAGWAMARLARRSLPRFARDVDLLWPLLWDGYGFHQGFFASATYVRARVAPPLHGYAARAFDQGLGRSLWFVEGASPARIAATIASFPADRRGDLWSGAGLACAYAGGLDGDGVRALTGASGSYRGDFAQGVVFAAKARHRAGNVTSECELASAAVLGVDAAGAASIADDELERTDSSGDPRYESWRSRIRARFATRPQEDCP